MLRRIALGLLGAAALAALPTFAQDVKKDTPRKKERIAINDPAKLVADADFKIQGEYANDKFGVQVVALGDGAFDVKLFDGGLPGAGADMKSAKKGKANREDIAIVRVAISKGLTGTIASGTMTLGDATLKKVERKSKTLGAKPPEGAVVLFAKPGDEKNWNGGKLIELSDGKFLNVGVTSKQAFGAFKAHAEFRLPWMPNSRGQGRGNSGVYLQNRYECQVLDSFGLAGENNECGGIYTQHKPLVNMCLPPMLWQTYDIEFTPAKFSDGKKVANGRATIYHNGVKIHDNIEFPKECPGGQKEAATPGPFQFQNHGDPVVYRNVWVLETK
ncbi:MAG TPA: DUF1080 domain-containing protein [Urbifossiella sp.]|nr:DUF1080 domain-containing protein [Urbifossiella sp.]